MATGALDVNGIWQYGEDDSNATFSALLNRLGSSTSTAVGILKAIPHPILQVKNWSGGGYSATSSSTYVDTYITNTITPTKSTSKILVLASVNGVQRTQTMQESGMHLQLLRGSTVIATLAYAAGYTGTFAIQNPGNAASSAFLDNPGTTSAVTYKVQFRNNVTGAEVAIGLGGAISSLTLVEVAA